MADVHPAERWLVLQLAAPLMAFGGVLIDQIGETRDFPAASMLTGLLANALGLQRTNHAAHQTLQDRLVFAAGLAPDSDILLDMQNAKLEKADKGWTTRGAPEGRNGASYNAPHRRTRYYLMDACTTVVLRLTAAADGPDLDQLAAAVQYPQRPLFIGRKPCLPTGQLFQGFVQATTARAALTEALSTQGSSNTSFRAIWPANDPEDPGDRIMALADLRDWQAGLHTGSRMVVEGRIHIGAA